MSYISIPDTQLCMYMLLIKPGMGKNFQLFKLGTFSAVNAAPALLGGTQGFILTVA